MHTQPWLCRTPLAAAPHRTLCTGAHICGNAAHWRTQPWQVRTPLAGWCCHICIAPMHSHWLGVRFWGVLVHAGVCAHAMYCWAWPGSRDCVPGSATLVCACHVLLGMARLKGLRAWQRHASVRARAVHCWAWPGSRDCVPGSAMLVCACVPCTAGHGQAQVKTCLAAPCHGVWAPSLAFLSMAEDVRTDGGTVAVGSAGAAGTGATGGCAHRCWDWCC